MTTNNDSAQLAHRVKQANKVIELIASKGRRFFYSEAHKRLSRFGLDKYGQIFYVDHYTGMKIYPFAEGYWPGFTSGQTLKAFIARLAQYVKTGEPMEAHWFPIEYDASQWAYGEEVMRALLAEVIEQTTAVQIRVTAAA